MAFRGKVALVTGAGSGMGQLSAWRLAEAGATVACLDRNEVGLAHTAERGDALRVFPCDVTDGARVDAVVAEVERDLGPIDRVIHAAGIMPTAPILEMPRDLIHTLMRVNYGGTVNVTKATLPSMIARGRGDLVLYGSLAGHVLAPHFGAYNASKAAVNAFAEVLIRENRGSGVRILLVCPPMARTPLIDQATGSSNPRSLQLGIRQGRLADPLAVVDAAEKALENGQEILFPTGEAKVLYRLRRLAPNLLWRLIFKAEQSGPT